MVSSYWSFATYIAYLPFTRFKIRKSSFIASDCICKFLFILFRIFVLAIVWLFKLCVSFDHQSTIRQISFSFSRYSSESNELLIVRCQPFVLYHVLYTKHLFQHFLLLVIQFYQKMKTLAFLIWVHFLSTLTRRKISFFFFIYELGHKVH